MNKNHTQSIEWLVMQHHDGQLPERHRREVEAHLADCDRCRRYAQATQSAAVWLHGAAGQAARTVTFEPVWRGVAGRLEASRWSWWDRVTGATAAWPLRPGWLAAGGVIAAVLLTVINPFSRLPALPSHETYVTFVEAGEHPVMILPPSQSGDMTVIWLFEAHNGASGPPT